MMLNILTYTDQPFRKHNCLFIWSTLLTLRARIRVTRSYIELNSAGILFSGCWSSREARGELASVQ